MRGCLHNFRDRRFDDETYLSHAGMRWRSGFGRFYALPLSLDEMDELDELDVTLQFVVRSSETRSCIYPSSANPATYSWWDRVKERALPWSLTPSLNSKVLKTHVRHGRSYSADIHALLRRV